LNAAMSDGPMRPAPQLTQALGLALRTS